MAFFIEKAVQGLAAGVGLASESYQHHKEKKQLKKDGALHHSQSDDSTTTVQSPSPKPEDSHQAAWELDEAQDELHQQPADDHKGTTDGPLIQGKGIEDPMKIADNFIKRHPPPIY
jgi:hypothetical protein